MSKDVRDELDRLRTAMHEQLRRADKVMEELRRIQDAIAAVLRQTDPGAPKLPGKAKRHR